MNQTPLHWAAKRGFNKLVTLFCDYNPNYNARDIVRKIKEFIVKNSGVFSSIEHL